MTRGGMSYRWVNVFVLGSAELPRGKWNQPLGPPETAQPNTGIADANNRTGALQRFCLLIVSLFSTARLNGGRAMKSATGRLLFLQLRDLQLVAHLRPRAVDSMGR